MEAIIMDSSYNDIAILDVFESFIWTDRYDQYGDFEVYLPVLNASQELLTKENYVTTKGSDHVMIIECHEIQTDPENGNHLTVTGRSLESILDRRIIWGQTILTGDFQTAIQKLLNENAISPTDTSRTIPNLIFLASENSYITGLTIDAQFNGESLYDAISSLCREKNVGFKMTLTSNNQIQFELYYGADHSYSQETNPLVIFSPTFDNLASSNYISSIAAYKTAALVAGEGSGSSQKLVEADPDEKTGLERREMYVSASDVSSKTTWGTLSDAEYTEQLIQKGKEELSRTSVTQSFEGEIDSTGQFVYGIDFNLGDIVQIRNEYGMEAVSRVSEIVRYSDGEKEKINPTFVVA